MLYVGPANSTVRWPNMEMVGGGKGRLKSGAVAQQLPGDQSSGLARDPYLLVNHECINFPRVH